LRFTTEQGQVLWLSAGAEADAVADLGKPDEIGRVFTGFQQFLYQPQPLA
jgi:hypothetical protein